MAPPGDEALAREVEEIRAEYQRRSASTQTEGQYSFLNPAHAYLVLEREREILAALARHAGGTLAELEVLDVGCSSGVSLALLAAYGADPGRLHGVDTDAGRIATGADRFPAFDLRVSDGVTLPYPDASFDLVQQITMLSSVHSDALRARIAAEMRRVVRAGGLILSFDAAPVPVLPRLLNRALAVGRRSPSAVAASSPAPVDEPALRQIRPLAAADLRALFAPAVELDVRRLSPYRPLVERLGARARFLPRGFSTTVLYLARA
jgi:ubiquinone/menaquinone biosynthesis C-methylase UbiE